MDIKKLSKLALTFLKIGAFTFGGGYAMISLLENEFVSKHKWVDKDEFFDIVAISESTPGPVAINSATYIGYKVCGFWGALVSTVSIALPSLTIIYLISLFFDAFLKFELVKKAFLGIQVCVIYLIFSAGIKFFKNFEKSIKNIIIFICVALAFVTLSLLSISFSSIFYILISVLIGIVSYSLSKIKKRGSENKK